MGVAIPPESAEQDPHHQQSGGHLVRQAYFGDHPRDGGGVAGLQRPLEIHQLLAAGSQLVAQAGQLWHASLNKFSTKSFNEQNL